MKIVLALLLLPLIILLEIKVINLILILLSAPSDVAVLEACNLISVFGMVNYLLFIFIRKHLKNKQK